MKIGISVDQYSDILKVFWGKKSKNYRLYPMFLPYILCVPALVALILVLISFGLAVYYSMTNMRLINPYFEFIWFINYQELLHSDSFLYSIRLTLAFACVMVLIQIPIGLGIAMLLAQDRSFVRIFRTLTVIPLMMPPVIAGLMWKMMLAPDGVINYMLGLRGVPWLADHRLALPSIFVIEFWLTLPFVVLVLLSGLQSLPRWPMEAAAVDGASAWQVLRYIIIPLLRPFIYLVVLFRFIDALKVFDTIMATTRGGPGVATKLAQVAVYDEVFKNQNMGKGLAAILLMWLLSYLLSQFMVRRWFVRHREYVE